MSNNYSMAAATSYWWNQNYLSMNDGACAVIVDTIIEVWCAQATRDMCCGLCMDNTFAGVGPMIFYMSSSVSTAISVLLAADEAWGIIVLQMLWVSGQFLGLWIPQTAYAKTIPKWVAYLQVPVSMGTIPVLTALVFSPIWEQGGRSIAQVFDLKARADAQVHVHGPQAHRRPRRRGRWSRFLPRFLRRQGPHAPISLEVGESNSAANLMEAHRSAWWGTVPFWAVGTGAVWLLDITIMCYFYATKIWGNNEQNYWSQPECDSHYDNLDQIQSISIALIVIQIVLSVWQVVGVIHPSWGAADVFSKALNVHLRRRRDSDQRGERTIAGWNTRHPQVVQWVATWAAILGWLGLVLGLYVPKFLKGGFLVAGSDPFIPFQVQGDVMIVPHVISIIRAYRANVFRRRQREELVANYPEALKQHILHLLEQLSKEPVTVYDVRDAMEVAYEEDRKDGAGRRPRRATKVAFLDQQQQPPSYSERPPVPPGMSSRRRSQAKEQQLRRTDSDADDEDEDGDGAPLMSGALPAPRSRARRPSDSTSLPSDGSNDHVHRVRRRRAENQDSQLPPPAHEDEGPQVRAFRERQRKETRHRERARAKAKQDNDKQQHGDNDPAEPEPAAEGGQLRTELPAVGT